MDEHKSTPVSCDIVSIASASVSEGWESGCSGSSRSNLEVIPICALLAVSFFVRDLGF